MDHYCPAARRPRRPRDTLTLPVETGELHLTLIETKARGKTVVLSGNEPGFTLPANIGDLPSDIKWLNLSNCSMRGTLTTHHQD